MLQRTFGILAALAVSAGVARQNPPPHDPQTILRATAQEVLLDFIARDKHQKLVTDLRADDIEVLEDGVPQTLRSLEYRGARDQAARQNEPVPARTSTATQSLREINLVSMVFEGVDAESRREAMQAAKDFLANQVDPNTYIGVFTLNQRLALLQQYTNDAVLLNRAVNLALAGSYQQYQKSNDAEVAKLNSLAAGQSGRFQAMHPGSAEERGPEDAGRFTEAERRMAQMSIQVLTNQVGNLSIDALEQLVEAQTHLPGRKTIIYFSPALILPPDQPERFRAVISAANRANVTFYTVDPSGLNVGSSISTAERTNSALGAMDGDRRPRQTNVKESLRSLAEDTGGFAIADTNDARIPLRHVMEEVRAHYEATYAPAAMNYDGHFRTIEIRSRKAGIHLQGRQGYFALPLVAGETLAPFEFDALTVLNQQPPPHAFDFHAEVLIFRATAESTECRAVFSVPSQALHFTENRADDIFHLHVEFLALVKDDSGQVVRKVSRDVTFQASANRREEFERGEVIVTLPLDLPPGRYHLETVAKDVDGAAASTRTIALTVPSEGTLSDIVVVRSFRPTSGNRDMTDPLETPGGKITSEVGATVTKGNSAVVGIYFVVYPAGNANPDVRIAVTHDGKPVSALRPLLPEAEADGSLRVLSQIPFGGFDPGVYEVTVTAVVGANTARRTALVEVR